MEEEEEALRNHCRRMIRRVQRKQQQPEEERRRHGGAGGRQRRTESERRVAAGGGSRVHSGCGDLQQRSTPDRGRASLSLGCRSVPPQLISMLRLKTLKEEMRRAAEVELHDPAVCSVCEQQQAALALKSFIRRKKTQLQFQTLKGRLSTHWSSGVSDLKPQATCVRLPASTSVSSPEQIDHSQD